MASAGAPSSAGGGAATPKGKRLKGVTIERPFIYGSAAFFIGRANSQDQNSYRWTVYVRGVDGEDLSYFIRKVSFQLHQSFHEPLRVVERAPFEVTETGWGEFVIEIKVHFVDAREAPVTLQHQLKLFHEGGQPSAARKPVVSEHFDEFVFSEPFEPLYRALVAGPSSRFEQHPLQQYFNAQQHGEHEQRQVARLAAIQKDVSARFDALRKRLFDANAEVRALARQLGLPDEPAPEPALPAAVATAALSAAASSAPSSTPAPAPAPSAADPAPS